MTEWIQLTDTVYDGKKFFVYVPEIVAIGGHPGGCWIHTKSGLSSHNAVTYVAKEVVEEVIRKICSGRRLA